MDVQSLQHLLNVIPETIRVNRGQFGREEFLQIDVQSSCDRGQSFDGHVNVTSLYSTIVAGVEVGCIGDILLGEATLLSETPDVTTESSEIGLSHEGRPFGSEISRFLHIGTVDKGMTIITG